MNDMTEDVLHRYRVRTIAAFVMASGASAMLALGYLLGLL